jgi:site-specific DNA-methyltransferase (adenine-specific)
MDEIQLIQGDTFEVMETLESGSVGAIITDSPYGTTSLPWDHKINLPRWWELAKRVIRPGGAIVMCSAQPFTTDLIVSNRKWFRYELIWKKTAPVGFLDANIRPMRLHENILVFCETFRRSNDGKRAAMTYNPQFTVGKPYTKKGKPKRCNHYNFEGIEREVVNDGRRYPVDVLEVPNRGGPSYHPTQKPVELMEWIVRTYTNPGEVVLDPYVGGGATMVACKNAGRRGIGIDRAGEYLQITRERLAA